ncbi:MAG: hypothetical protein GY862_22035 [Gammaproteobacteria bacterium]|nr:hypothetical protein [Gammaproteobacteria bacterium]
MSKITLLTLESDYDAEAVRIIAHKILSVKGLKADIHALKPKGPVVLKKDGLKDAVKNFLKESACVIFIIDRDGPMSKAERRKQPNSLINQAEYVVSLYKSTGKVHLVEAVNELESWFLVDCIGVFSCISKSYPSLPKECKNDIISEICRNILHKNKNYMKIILKYSVGDTTKIEEPVSGSNRGVKEYLIRFSGEIYKLLHPGSRKIHDSWKYTEAKAPDIAKFIKLDSSTINKNFSLKKFSDLISACVSNN